MPTSQSTLSKLLQFTKTHKKKRVQQQSTQNGLIPLPICARPNENPSRHREESEPLLHKEKERPIRSSVFPFMLSVSPQNGESKTPRKTGFFHGFFRPSKREVKRRREKLRGCLFCCDAVDYHKLKPLPVPSFSDYQKSLPALPLPDYDKPLPPVPEREEVAFLFR